MASINDRNQSKRKWWLHPMDPENLVELSDSDKRNAKSYNHWLLVWGMMFFGVVLGLEPLSGGINATPIWRVALVLAPMVSAVFLVRAFLRFFNETKDELVRKIYYEALGMGFLFAFFTGICLELAAVVVGQSVKAGPVMFAGLLIGYFVGLTLKYRQYNV